MRLAIVILNFNGEAHLEKYLPSVVAHSAGHRIIVADNGSSDASEQVVNGFPGVEWLALRQNFGFAEGYNQALKGIDADVYVLLNSDVRVSPGWTASPMQMMSADESIAAVQPKILDDKRPDHFEYAGASGGFLDALAYPYCRGRIFDVLEKDEGQYDSPVQVDWTSGACCFVRKEAWESAGGFDGWYFAHMEEIDLCWRWRRAGWTLWVDPGSTVWHLGGGTLAYASPRKTFLNFRNALATLFRNEPGPGLAPKLILRLLLDGVAGLRFVLQGQWGLMWSIVRAHWSFFGRIPKLWGDRGRLPAPKGSAVEHSNASHKGVTSIVWSHFVRGISKFSNL